MSKLNQKVLKIIGEIMERSVGDDYIYRGEPKDYGKKVASSLYRQVPRLIWPLI